MHRIVCAVNESLYYQMLCKGLIQSILKYQKHSFRLTLLLDGINSQPLHDLRNHLEIIRIQPFDMICGSVPSRTTFARLDIPELFPHVKRILYLDVDTFLMNNIDDLFTVPFKTLAAVVPGQTLMISDLLKREFKTKLSRLNYQLDGIEYLCGIEDHKYFNAGSFLPISKNRLKNSAASYSGCRSDVNRCCRLASLTHQRACSSFGTITSIEDVYE